MATKVVYAKRKFLNTDITQNAFINASVERVNYLGEDKDCVWAGVTISDCSRMVTLDFDFHNKTQKKKVLKKMDVLIDTLSNMRDALEAEEF